nr:MAG TPA: hypothetical protein [Caudoviricetes sp.]
MSPSTCSTLKNELYLLRLSSDEFIVNSGCSFSNLLITSRYLVTEIFQLPFSSFH